MERGQFTYQEILSQPDAWQAGLVVLSEHCKDIEAIWHTPYSQVLFTGCGSTYYLALAAAALTQELVGIPARGVPASELWLYPESYYPPNARTLLVAVSRSGETTETLRACQAFLNGPYGELVTLSCYPEMPLAKLGLLNLVFSSGQEQSVAQTRAFSTLYLACSGLAAMGSGVGLGDFYGLPEVGGKVLEAARPIAQSLGQDAALERFYFLGSGPRYGLACEISLKMKEMSLSHSEPFHLPEFRHGPKSMVTPNSLIVGLLSNTHYAVEAAVLEDVRLLGGRTLSMGEVATDLEFASGLRESLRNVLYLPLGQLIAFERSLAKGLNPDRPNNLDTVVKLV